MEILKKIVNFLNKHLLKNNKNNYFNLQQIIIQIQLIKLNNKYQN